MAKNTLINQVPTKLENEFFYQVKLKAHHILSYKLPHLQTVTELVMYLQLCALSCNRYLVCIYILKEVGLKCSVLVCCPNNLSVT